MWILAPALLLLATSVRAQVEGVVPTINVRLKPGSSISDLQGIEPKYVKGMRKSFSLSDEELDTLVESATTESGKLLPDLKLWHTIQLDPNASPDLVLKKLKISKHVDVAELFAKPPPPPGAVRGRSLAATPNYESLESFLDPAPHGINAKYAWTKPGGTGGNVKIYDIEYGWNQDHEDLNLNVPLLADTTPVNPFDDDNHGTAVLGELVGNNDAKGVLGIAYEAEIGLCPEYTREGSVRGDAILKAVRDGTPGDIILLEQQTWACDTGDYGPAEWDQVVFDATSIATAAGFVVVAAAGNGNLNLDSSSCNGAFNLNRRDSGAIILGAGAPPKYPLPRSRLYYSSYGSRVDVQGWGWNVVTAGYGDLFTDADNPDNEDRWYTGDFGGTSSASPIVAGAAALLQSYSKTRFNSRLTSTDIRQVSFIFSKDGNVSYKFHLSSKQSLFLCNTSLTKDLSQYRNTTTRRHVRENRFSS
jgi:serine protease